MKVLDPITGREQRAPLENAHESFLAGRFHLKPGSMIPMRGPDGSTWSIPAEDVNHEIRRGARIDMLAQDPGAFAAAAEGAIGGATADISDTIAIEGAGLIGGEEAKDAVRDHLERSRLLHPVAHGVGEAAGMVASMLVPGAGEAAVTGDLAKVAKGATLAEDLAKGGSAARGLLPAAEAEARALSQGERVGAGLLPEARTAAGAEARGAGEEVTAAGGPQGFAKRGGRIEAEGVPPEAAAPQQPPIPQAAQMVSAAEEAGTKAIADVAAAGRTQGSALSSFFRVATAPQRGIIAAGDLAEGMARGALGDSALARIASGTARGATEGLLYDMAQGLDEDELGDHEITAESLLAHIGPATLVGAGIGGGGAVFGTLARGALRPFAGMANEAAVRLAEANLGGTPRQYARAARRWGRGELGREVLESGIESPMATPEQRLDRARRAMDGVGKALDDVLEHGDVHFDGVKVSDVHARLDRSLDKALQGADIAGVNATAVKERIMNWWENAVGWRRTGPIPPFNLEKERADLYSRAWRQAGLPSPSEMAKRVPVEPVAASMEQIEARAQEILSSRARIPTPINEMPRNVRENLRTQAERELNAGYEQDVADYQRAKDEFQHVQKQHDELLAQADTAARDAEAEHFRTVERLKEDARRNNEELRVPFLKMAEIRRSLDKEIPYHRDLSSFIVDAKRAARGAIEDGAFDQMDKAARDIGKPEIAQRYVDLKDHYGKLAALHDMAIHGEAAYAAGYGMGERALLGSHFLLGALMGHPAGGVVSGAIHSMVRKYGRSAGAVLLSKVGALAELKAAREAVEVGMRKSVRAAILGTDVAPQARIDVTRLQQPGPEARGIALDNMRKLIRSKADPETIAAALRFQTGGMSVHAPKTFVIAVNKAQAAITYLSSLIPARFHANPNMLDAAHVDITDKEASDFNTAVAVIEDPRVATDALATGTLTPNMAAAFRASTSALAQAQTKATIGRMAQTDKHRMEAVPMFRQQQLALFAGTPPPGIVPGAAQALLLATKPAAEPSPTGGSSRGRTGGISRAKNPSPDLALLLTTESERVESGSPGRKPKLSTASSRTR